MGQETSKEKYHQYVRVASEKEIPVDHHEFWRFFLTSWKDLEVYELLTPVDIRVIRKRHPENLSVLIFKCIEQMVIFCKDVKIKDQLSIQNSIAYLTRILPILFENDDDGFVHSLFVKNMKNKKIVETIGNKKEGDEMNNGKKQFFPFNPEDEKDFDEKFKMYSPDKNKNGDKKKRRKSVSRRAVKKEVKSIFNKLELRVNPNFQKIKKKNKTKKKEEKKKLNPPKRTSSIGVRFGRIANEKLVMALYKKFVHTLYSALFLPDFSIPQNQIKPQFRRKQDFPESLDVNLLWEGGLCVPKGKFFPSTQQLENRKKALKCLIASCSSSLYINQKDLLTRQNRNYFLEALVSEEAPSTANLFFSLLNVISNYNPTGSLPYTSVLFRDATEELTVYSIQFLALVLSAPAEENVFVEYVKSIKTNEEMKCLLVMFKNLFRNAVDSDNTYLPNSQKKIIFLEELFVVFWKFLEHNPKFRYYICREEEILDLLCSVLYILNVHSEDPAQFPFLQVIGFCLLLLSEERQLGVSMNRPFSHKLPIKKMPLFTGSYFDFMVILFYKLIVEDQSKVMKPLLNCLLTIIHNLSAYAKTMCITSSVRLLSLLDLLCKDTVLYSSPTNHDMVFLILNSLNNLIQYQYDGSHNIVYSILRKKDLFIKLSKEFTQKDLDLVLENLKKKKKNYVPKLEEIQSWRKRLPLTTIVAVINNLIPEIEKFCEKNVTEDRVLSFIKETTLVGLLPVPHNIVIRTFKTSPRIKIFLMTFVWGLIYVKGLNFIPYESIQFDPKQIKLFSVKTIGN